MNHPTCHLGVIPETMNRPTCHLGVIPETMNRPTYHSNAIPETMNCLICHLRVIPETMNHPNYELQVFPQIKNRPSCQLQSYSWNNEPPTCYLRVIQEAMKHFYLLRSCCGSFQGQWIIKCPLWVTLEMCHRSYHFRFFFWINVAFQKQLLFSYHKSNFRLSHYILPCWFGNMNILFSWH